MQPALSRSYVSSTPVLLIATSSIEYFDPGCLHDRRPWRCQAYRAHVAVTSAFAALLQPWFMLNTPLADVCLWKKLGGPSSLRGQRGSLIFEERQVASCAARSPGGGSGMSQCRDQRQTPTW